jgi:hypothetical protein
VPDTLTGRPPERVFRRRRLIALGVLAGIVTLIGVAVGAGSDDGSSEPEPAVERRQEAAPPELPRGGRSVFPEFRVVAYYGAPQSTELGTLGSGSPAPPSAPCCPRSS